MRYYFPSRASSRIGLIREPVSQFTLLASLKKGNKPDFHQSAAGLKAKTLYQTFFKKVQDLYTPDKVKDGVFAAMMDVALVNDGPVGLDYTCLDGEVLLIILPPACCSSSDYYIANCAVRSRYKSIQTRPKWQIQLRSGPVGLGPLATALRLQL